MKCASDGIGASRGTGISSMAMDYTTIQWFHTMDLGNGIVTPGRDNTPHKLLRLHLPERLDGKTVLDIGAWDGAFSFECERRGASRVLATDWYCWSGPGWGTKAGFDFAHRTLRSRVEAVEVDVLSIDPARIGQFDVVLFLGVLYHMRHPLLALERAAACCRDLLVIDTETCHPWTVRPVVRYYLDTDNWCAPNLKWLHIALRDLGFSRIRIAWRTVGPVRLARAIRRWLMWDKARLWSEIGRGRAVVHAYRD